MTLCRLGLPLGYPCYLAACLQTRGHPSAELPRSFREASANLPRSTPAVLAFLAAVGICSSSKRYVSCTQQHLFFYWNCFSELFHARTETLSCISATKLPQTFRKQISSASLPHASARVARRTFSIIMSLSPLNPPTPSPQRGRRMGRAVTSPSLANK